MYFSVDSYILFKIYPGSLVHTILHITEISVTMKGMLNMLLGNKEGVMTAEVPNPCSCWL